LGIALLTTSSCGPGDAPFKFIFKEVALQLEAPKPEATASGEISALSANCTSITGLQVDIGLVKDGESKMQSNPRHLHIDPAQGGWLVESSTTQDPASGVPAISLRLRGSRPQELRFTPGNYRLAINGSGNCITATSPSKKLPLVFYGNTRSFNPGQEIVVQANAKFAASGIEPKSTTPSEPSGFIYLHLSSVPVNGLFTKIELRSPTAPTLAGEWTVNSNFGYLGPVPAVGKYFVRIIYTYPVGSSNLQSKCILFDSAISAGTTIAGTEITPCPAPGSPLGQDAGNLP
jgi:hypothetical protein